MTNHLAIIVDGNGRWAKEKGLKRSEGHKEGAKRLEEIILYLSDNSLVKYLSLYVFSTENFARPKEEVDYLMKLFMVWFKKVKNVYLDKNIKVLFSGDRTLLSPKIQKSIAELEDNTKNNTGLVVNFCLSYGSRREIVEASKKIIKDNIKLSDITEDLFSHYLYQDLPDIDFLIRTSGEMRLSNFMLWQSSYAELYFPKTYFPDFTIDELKKALEEYKLRDRRFGKVK